MIELAAVERAMRAPLAVLDGPLPEAELSEWVDLLGRSQQLINALGAVQTVALAKVAATEDRRVEDGTVVEVSLAVGHVRMDAPALVSDLLGVSEHVAARRVHDAARIASTMAPVVRAMAAGRLDTYRASIVADELRDASPEVCRLVAGVLEPHLGADDAGPLRQRVRRVISRLAPDVLRQRATKARSDRGLRRWTDLFGTDQWDCFFPVERARPAFAAVDDLARRLRAQGEAMTLEQARADALLQLVTGQASAAYVVHLAVPASDVGSELPVTVPTAPATSAHDPVAFRCPDADSAQNDGSTAPPAGPDHDALVEVRGFGAAGSTYVPAGFVRSVLSGHAGPVSSCVVRCHPATGAIRSIEDPATRGGRPPTVRTDAYRPPSALVELVRARDGRCRFPGCHVAARFCDLDHVRPWPTGPTAADNLVCLCRRHHRIKQTDRWSARLEEDGSLLWVDPTGRRRVTMPVDHLGATTRDGGALPVMTYPAGQGGWSDGDAPPLAEVSPFRLLTDGAGYTWRDDGFSIYEDMLDLWARQERGRHSEDAAARVGAGSRDLQESGHPPGAADEPPF